VTIKFNRTQDQEAFQNSEGFNEKKTESLYKIKAKNSELTHRLGYANARARARAMPIYGVSLKRILTLMKEEKYEKTKEKESIRSK